MTHDIYFAKEDSEVLAAELDTRMDQWASLDSQMNNLYSGLVSSFPRNLDAYYSTLGGTSNRSSLDYSGVQGELVSMQVPLARTLIRQFVTLISKQRYNFEVLSNQTDANPIQTARFGKALCNSIVEKNNVDTLMEQVAERTAVLGNSFLSCVWKSDKGYPFSRNNDDSINYSGDVHIEMHDFWDICFDYSNDNFEDLAWVLLRRKRNRHDLISQYPDLKDAIASIPAAYTQLSKNGIINNISKNEDMIWVKEFYHKPTPALPEGRFTAFASEKCIFFDELDNPYGGIPIIPFRFETIQSTCLGYPLLSSLLPSQEAFNSCMSTILTNQSAFGVQSVLVPRGAGLGLSEVTGGMNFIEYTPLNAEGGGVPQPLQLTQTPVEIFNFAKDLKGLMGELSMVNDTLRGAPPPNVTSGTMAATISANALEFLSSASKNLTIGMEKTMNWVLQNYKTFATVEQLVDVVGEDGIGFTKEFKQDDLSDLKKIKIRTQSPIMNSIAGRLQLSEAVLPMLQQGQNDAINKYFSIIEGAPVDILFKSELSEQVAVSQEIDALLQGKAVIPIATDNHPLFILQYKELLYNQHVRTNSELLQHVLDLMSERIEMEQNLNPILKAMLRGQPMPEQQPQQQQQGAPASQTIMEQPDPLVASPSPQAEPTIQG